MTTAPMPVKGKSTSLAELKERTKGLPPDTPLSFFSAGGLDLMQRAAYLLTNSTLVPTAYRDTNEIKNANGGREMVKNPNAISNCVLALNMAQRIGADPLMIMQNLYIVDGKPGWSSQFVIASINACGKFSPLRFEIEDRGEKEVQWTTVRWKKNPQTGKSFPEEITHKGKVRDKVCRAWAIEKSTGERIDGPEVSMDMAVAEGWFGKNGSKWQTMPDVMLRYRAASFFGKLYAPELLMGLQTAEEVRDTVITFDQGEDGTFEAVLDTELVDVLDEPKNEPEAPAENPQPAQAENGNEQQAATDKKTADRQRAAKAAAKRKANGNEQRNLANAQEEPPVESEEEMTPQDRDIRCPKDYPDGTTRFVSEDDCFYCSDRSKGCPNWNEEF